MVIGMTFLLLLSLLIGASTEDDYVGARTCLTCHREVYAAWSRGPHARSTLPRADAKDPRCVGCHRTGLRPDLATVQCESCHGPGRRYAVDYVMKDAKLARALGLIPSPGEEVCGRCHRPEAPRFTPMDFQEARERIHTGRSR